VKNPEACFIESTQKVNKSEESAGGVSDSILAPQCGPAAMSLTFSHDGLPHPHPRGRGGNPSPFPV